MENAQYNNIHEWYIAGYDLPLMYTRNSPGQRWVLEPKDLPSSSYLRSDRHFAGGCRASLLPSALPSPPQTHPDSALL